MVNKKWRKSKDAKKPHPSRLRRSYVFYYVIRIFPSYIWLVRRAKVIEFGNYTEIVHIKKNNFKRNIVIHTKKYVRLLNQMFNQSYSFTNDSIVTFSKVPM